jgi:hypothetical protein
MSANQQVEAAVVPRQIPTIDQVREAFKSIPDINKLVNLSGPTTSQDISDVVMNDRGEVEGVRITFPVNPTLSAVYCGEKTGGVVALFVFPGDDSVLTASVILAITESLKHLDVEIVLADSFAPVFHENGGVSFSPDKIEILKALAMKYEGALAHINQALLRQAQPQSEILVPKQPEIIIPG